MQQKQCVLQYIGAGGIKQLGCSGICLCMSLFFTMSSE